MKNPDFLPPWGCPWHGLIKNGQLHLPGDKTLAWPQPPNGDTHLIDFGVPAVETSEDHAEQGKQWLNKAIIAGGYLHGVELPAGSWIWRDDNGESWLVNIPEFVSSISSVEEITVTLSRFGLIGGAAESHQYPAAFPDVYSDARSVHASAINALFARLSHAKKDGSSAIIKITSLGAPVSFVEISLSGAGSSCTVSIDFIRDAEDTSGTHSEAGTKFSGASSFTYKNIGYLQDGSGPPNTGGSHDPGVYPDCNTEPFDMVWNMMPNPAGGYGYSTGSVQFIGRTGTRTHSESLTGAIIGLFYKESGEVAEVTADISMETTAQLGEHSVSSEPLVHHMVVTPSVTEQKCVVVKTGESGWHTEVQQVCESEQSCDLRLKLDGVELLTTGFSATLVARIRGRVSDLGLATGQQWREYTYTENDSDPITKSAYAPGMPPSTAMQIDPVLLTPMHGEKLSVVNLFALALGSHDLHDFREEADRTDYFQRARSGNWVKTIAPYIYSNTMYGACVSESRANSYDHMQVAIVPTGAVALPSIPSDVGSPHGSYNPITGATERDTAPVSWT